MIQIDFLSEIIQQQKISLEKKDVGMIREKLETLPAIENFAVIISGIRRCGKSTLLHQLLAEKYPDALYINFDDPRLHDFEISDFTKIDKIITGQNSSKVLMFDEIQIITGWERYIRQKLDEGFKVFVTGSNASLLSRELGTSLTGRHLTKELFPFSYSEFCKFREYVKEEASLMEYIRQGGFPEYLLTSNEEVLATLLDDILIRDIAVRYNIRDTRGLKRLTLFLLSNIGNLISANKLKEPSGINSATTILEYISHLENSYLISLVPMFSHSLKKQTVNLKKIYAIDTGLVSSNVSKLKENAGHKLENMVYNSLRHNYKEIYYHKGVVECDFVIVEKGAVQQVIQVCHTLDSDNRNREITGLVDAMKTYKLNKGTIVTLSQEDLFNLDGGLIVEVVPGFKFLN